MRVLAMYLPQFHRVKENDEWWGEGFTEWTTVKNAVPLYEGHYQPHEPLNDNYYDLLDKSTMKWQSELMHTYGVDGMCFYHYWFKDGRQILEKPAENLLRWKDINMPFCFCWANVTWARSWSNITNKSVWTSSYEKGEIQKDTGILLEQKYGEEKDWKKHFQYLLTFFKDERYIKIDNKPLILLYRTSLIHCLDVMLSKWREWAKEAGLPDLYIIGCSSYDVADCLDANLSPIGESFSLNELTASPEIQFRFNYDGLWNNILQRRQGRNCYYQGVVGYDTTPRHGERGLVFDNAMPEKFKIFLAKLLAKSQAEGKDIVFLNAWNEWGEGMHLEPDKKFGYDFLEGVRWAKENYQNFADEFTGKIEVYNNNQSNEDILAILKHYEKYWRILDAWLKLKESNVSIVEYLLEKGYKNVAIYGAGMLGRHLIAELKDSDINIKYLVDRKAGIVNNIYPIYLPKETLPQNVNVIIVATVQDYEKIYKLLKEKGDYDILYLEKLIMEMS